MKKRLWHKRIPTFPALAVLFLSIFVTSYLLQRSVNIIGQASPDKTPQNVEISNITDSSFTVSFITTAKTISGLQLSFDEKSSQTYFDERNKSFNEEFYSHFIRVTGLAPERTYEFSILSGGQIYLNGQNKYKITTAPKITGSTNSFGPVVGKVLLPDGTAGTDVIVVAEIQGAQRVSGITGPDGTYSISISSIRNGDLNNFFPILKDTPILLKFIRQGLESTIKTVASAVTLIPTTTLSYKYDFSEIEQTSTQTLSSELKSPLSSTGEVTIFNPQPGQSFIDERPLFQGTSGENQRVNITVTPEQIRTSVTADENGIWSYRPDSPLDIGSHEITVRAYDSLGIYRTVSASFAIFAQGTQLAQAGPTVTPTPRAATPTPTRIPSPTQTPAPTAIAATATPTSAPTIAPTQTPAPTTVLPSATPIPTQTPSSAPTATPRPIAVTPEPMGDIKGSTIAVVSIVLVIAGGAILFLL